MPHHIDSTLYREAKSIPLCSAEGKTLYDKSRAFVNKNMSGPHETDWEMLGLTALALLAFDTDNRAKVTDIAAQDIGTWTVTKNQWPRPMEFSHIERSARVALAEEALQTMAAQYGRLALVRPPFAFGNLVRNGVIALTEELRLPTAPLNLSDEDIMAFIREVSTALS